MTVPACHDAECGARKVAIPPHALALHCTCGASRTALGADRCEKCEWDASVMAIWRHHMQVAKDHGVAMAITRMFPVSVDEPHP